MNILVIDFIKFIRRCIMKNSIMLFILMISFISLHSENWKPGEEFTDPRDGQTYKTSVFGNQVWMTENMNIGTLVESDKPGPIMKDDGIIEKYCWGDELGGCNGELDGVKRGGFYEWREAVQYYQGQPTLPVKGICPEGWHIPSMDEWNALLNYFVQTYDASTYAKLAQVMLQGGDSGFDAVLTGYRCTANGEFRVSAMSSDTRTYYYTAEESNDNNAPALEIGYSSFSSFNIPKSIGLCIRCILDDNTSSNPDDKENDGKECTIFPNPASEYIMITGLEYNTQIQIITPQGKILFDDMYKGRVDVSFLSTGVYIIRINMNQFVRFVKL